MRKTLPLAVFLVCVLIGYALVPVAAQPGPPRTYTCLWDHDGANTDTYTISVDGALSVTVPNDAAHCPAATPRVCSSPLTMTTNVPHVVVVKAVNVFGEAAADPFSAAPPGSRPASVVIR